SSLSGHRYSSSLSRLNPVEPAVARRARSERRLRWAAAPVSATPSLESARPPNVVSRSKGKSRIWWGGRDLRGSGYDSRKVGPWGAWGAGRGHPPLGGRPRSPGRRRLARPSSRLFRAAHRRQWESDRVAGAVEPRGPARTRRAARVRADRGPHGPRACVAVRRP